MLYTRNYIMLYVNYNSGKKKRMQTYFNIWKWRIIYYTNKLKKKLPMMNSTGEYMNQMKKYAMFVNLKNQHCLFSPVCPKDSQNINY